MLALELEFTIKQRDRLEKLDVQGVGQLERREELVLGPHDQEGAHRRTDPEGPASGHALAVIEGNALPHGIEAEGGTRPDLRRCSNLALVGGPWRR